MNRRNLLTAAAASVMLPSAVMAGKDGQIAHPDAELLAACAEFDRLERGYLALGFGYDEETPEGASIEAEQSRLAEEQELLVDRICELRAVTREGQAARARSLALWDAELMKPQYDIAGRLTQAIVRDLIEGSAVA